MCVAVLVVNVFSAKVSLRKMSKRNSLGNTSGSNTLFKYFTKSPAQSPRTPQQQSRNAVSNNSTTPKSSFSKDKSIVTKGRSDKKNVADDQCDDDDEIVVRSVKKPKRLKLIDSDSESEPDRENESDNVAVEHVPSSKKSSRSATDAPSIAQPKKKKMKMDPNVTTPASFEDKLKQMEVQAINDVEEKLEEIDDEPMLWPHNKMEFLKPEKITDINGHRPDHPDYDPKTLFVPKSFLDKLTPVRSYPS